ncbi:translation initiation factor IF-2-like [Pyrgilauda ruficollis]|uniref:translation initiation factor IF-2-like n=1 Tax=Pyrgilauda ruficollis TaxID=221976 RepID=UPI001B880444|nr:translation initiation factor IF-2-like [Pyrgilauda ruficollis]
MCSAGAAARLSRLPGDRHKDPRRPRAKGTGPGSWQRGRGRENQEPLGRQVGICRDSPLVGHQEGADPGHTYSQTDLGPLIPASTGYPQPSCRVPGCAAGPGPRAYPSAKPRGAAPAAQPSPCPPRLAPPPRQGNGPGRLRSGSRPCGGGVGLSPCARRGGGSRRAARPPGGPSQVGARGRGCHRARPGSPPSLLPSLPRGPVTRGPRRARRWRARFATASVVAGAAAVRMPQLKGTGRQTTRPCAGPPPRPSRPRSPSRERLRAARQCCLERERSRRAASAAPSVTDEPPPGSERPGSSPVRPVCVRQRAGAAA